MGKARTADRLSEGVWRVVMVKEERVGSVEGAPGTAPHGGGEQMKWLPAHVPPLERRDREICTGRVFR